MEVHNIKPLYDEESEILILGSFPSVKSREGQFFYHHPQNRFWKVLAGIYEEETPISIEEKKAFILRHHIALWDVIGSCDIVGSSDSSITNVKPNDLSIIINHCPIRHIYTNGNLSYKYYQLYNAYDIPVSKLPSSSPANARFSLEKLIAAWKIIKEL